MDPAMHASSAPANAHVLANQSYQYLAHRRHGFRRVRRVTRKLNLLQFVVECLVLMG